MWRWTLIEYREHGQLSEIIGSRRRVPTPRFSGDGTEAQRAPAGCVVHTYEAQSNLPTRTSTTPSHRASWTQPNLTQTIFDDHIFPRNFATSSATRPTTHNVRCPQNLLVLPDPISAMGRAREARHVLVGRHRRPGACMLGRCTTDEADGRG